MIELRNLVVNSPVHYSGTYSFTRILGENQNIEKLGLMQLFLCNLIYLCIYSHLFLCTYNSCGCFKFLPEVFFPFSFFLLEEEAEELFLLF